MVPRATAIKRIVSTAIGLRLQLFSPSPAKNGSARSTMIPTAGPISSIGVSAEGGKKNETGKQYVLPHRLRHERYALLMRQLAVFLHVRGAPNNASRHGPFVNSKFQHHEQMDTDERDQQSRDYKDVQRKEPRERCTGNDRAAEHEVHSPRADHRDAAYN